MPLKYSDFVNEASKDDKKKWYTSVSDLEAEERKNTYSHHRYVGYDDDDGPPPHQGTYGSGSDSGDDWDDWDEDDEREDKFQDEGLDIEMGFDRKEDPKTPFNPGEDVVYLGNTGGLTYQEGNIQKIRDDGKAVVRFKESNRLIAISKHQLRHKLSEEEIEKRSAEWEVKKAEREKKKEEARKKREEAKKDALKPLPPGTKWWEKNK